MNATSTNRKIALIPAREGTVRLPGKNRKLLGGKPLFAHTVAAVVESGVFDSVILSTDDPEIRSYAKAEYDGEVVVHERLESLAGSNVTVATVLRALLSELGVSNGLCGVFLPTSPFRTAAHIKEAANLMREDYDSVVSVVEYDSPLAFAMQLNGESSRLNIPADSPLLKGKTQTQSHQENVHPNGAIYISRIDVFLKQGSFFSENMGGYAMDRISSLDIDTKDDFSLCELVLGHRQCGG